MDFIGISDSVIQYIGDSLSWIYTNWNGKKIKKGISYYGYSIIEGSEIRKLQNIIRKWKELFLLAPEEFYLTGGFMPDEEEYERLKINREALVENLELLLVLCEKAIESGMKILHNGI